MQSDWIYRQYALVAAADQDAANSACAAASGNPADGQTFAVPLSPTGEGPATHYGCSSALTESLRQALLGQLQVAPVASLLFWRTDAATGALLATSHAGSQGSVGQPWSWEQTLAALGLERIL